jgi:hypothetical protein
MSLDLNFDYSQVKKKIQASKSYNELKTDYDKTVKEAGDSFEQSKETVTETIDKVKEQTKRYQRDLKNQLEQLLDINNVTGGKGSNTIGYVKKLFLQTLKNIEPKIAEILNEESLNAIGCDQQQTFDSTVIWIRVSSIDLSSLLKKDPNEGVGKVLYEKRPIQIQSYPFSMNRELYQRIQSGQSYLQDNLQLYKGESGQDLFDIQFYDQGPFGQTGGWYKVTLSNRINGVNKVGEFLIDYYKTIKVVDFETIIPAIIESLTGAISIQASVGFTEAENTSKFLLLIQRVLGLCFDNAKEIDVSGVAKIAELDGIDESFFEFTDLDLRNIQQRVSNIQNGVVEYENCGNVKLPIDSLSILESLENIRFVPDNNLVDAADSVTQTITNNPQWQGLAITGNIQAAVDFNFVKLIAQGLVTAVLSPKVLLPIFIMLKALGQTIVDSINTFVDFIKQFKKFFTNLVSKIGAIFVQELFNLIKKDIKNLIQQIIKDLAKEKADKRLIIILKLIQLLILIANFISDWRKCKSVIDELLWLLKIATTGFGNEIPLPLLFGAQLLDGFSETRAFIGTIEEFQKLGIDTGALPDGSPNLGILSILGQLKASANENAENGKLQIALPPLTITPAGLTLPSNAFGKSL